MRLTLFFAFCCVFWSPVAAQDNADFTLESNRNGVKIFVRPERNGDMTVLIRTQAKTTVQKVLQVLDDAQAYPEWVHRCAEAYVVEGGTPNAYTYFSLVDMPFPFADREVVAAITQSIDPRTGVLNRYITSTPDALPPNKGRQRLDVYEAHWIVKPQADGMVAISCQVRTAAGSGLPNWLRKEVLTGGPGRTVANLVGRL